MAFTRVEVEVDVLSVKLLSFVIKSEEFRKFVFSVPLSD